MPFYAILKDRPYIAKLLFFIGITLICAFLFGKFANLITGILYGLEINAETFQLLDLDDKLTLSALKTFQIVQSIGLFFVPIALFVCLISEKPWHFLKLDVTISMRSVVLVALILFSAFPLITLLIKINESITFPDVMQSFEENLIQAEQAAEKLTKAFLQMESLSDLMVNLLMVGIIPAIGEELLFRGGLQQLLGKLFKNIHVAIILTAFLFGAMHGQFYGIIPRMLLGVLFGYLFYWSKSIWAPIVAHFIFNSIQVITYYLYLSNVIDVNIDKIDTVPYFITIISAIFLTACLFAFYRDNSKLFLLHGDKKID